jgi:hypothetical protein
VETYFIDIVHTTKMDRDASRDRPTAIGVAPSAVGDRTRDPGRGPRTAFGVL